MLLKGQASSLVLVLLISLPAIAQSPAPPEPAKTEQQQEARQAIEKKALVLLDEIISEVATLRLAENRALVQATAADLLWGHDEERARALFRDAINSMGQITAGVAQDDPQYESLARAYAELRQELLEILGRHDPHLARDFLRATGGPSQPGDELHLNLSLATQIAAKDPKQALQIAEESLAKRVSYQLVDLVSRLQEKDREAAAKLASGILTKLRSEDLATNQEAASIALDLVRVVTEPGQVGSGAGAPNATPIVTQQAVQELIEKVASAALRAPSSNLELLMMLEPMMPEVEKYASSLAPRVRRKIAETAKGFGGRDGDEPAPDEGQADQTQDGRKRLRSNEERAMELVQQAMDLAGKGEGKSALRLLNEARGLLVNRAKNSAQLSAQLQVARAYAALKPAQSFEIIELMIDQLSELAAATAVVDGFLTEEQLFRDDELLLQRTPQLMNMIFNDNVGELALLARADFNRIKAAADKFQRLEIRTMAHLLIAQSVLSDHLTAPRAQQK